MTKTNSTNMHTDSFSNGSYFDNIKHKFKGGLENVKFEETTHHTKSNYSDHKKQEEMTHEI